MFLLSRLNGAMPENVRYRRRTTRSGNMFDLVTRPHLHGAMDENVYFQDVVRKRVCESALTVRTAIL